MKELENRIEELELALDCQTDINKSVLETNKILYDMILNISDRVDIVKKTVDSSLDIMSDVVADKIIN
tara:strand:- start:59 stop:262 length:204 start_codon:yes stop_codon:yes gene_type:complete